MEYQIVQGLELDRLSQERIQVSQQELLEERDIVQKLLS